MRRGDHLRRRAQRTARRNPLIHVRGQVRGLHPGEIFVHVTNRVFLEVGHQRIAAQQLKDALGEYGRVVGRH